MQSLDDGESPVLTCRVPAVLAARITAHTGTSHGARSRWLRRVVEEALERERPPAEDQGPKERNSIEQTEAG